MLKLFFRYKKVYVNASFLNLYFKLLISTLHGFKNPQMSLKTNKAA